MMNTTRKFQEAHYPETRFGGFTDVDGTIAFYTRVNALLRPESVVVDFGCGRGAHSDDPVGYRRELRNLSGRAKRVIGIDVDHAAAANPFVDEFRFLESDKWPLDNRTTDLVFSDCVLEHLPDPSGFFSEARRVLRPGGLLCLRTTNLWSYVGIASKLIPNRAHAKVLSHVQDRRKGEDVFPALYRCNSISRIRRELRVHGFDGVVYGHEAEPSYLSFSRLAFALGVIHQKIAPSIFAPTIFAFARSTS
jgi:SAM-dependent methyltransferase